MPVNPTYPGVYVEEIPSGVRTIVGVGTSTAMFIGRAKKGELFKPNRCSSFDAFERKFTALDAGSDLVRAVKMFFMNGGTDCYVMRIADNTWRKSEITIKNEDASADSIKITAKSAGVAGDEIRIAVDYNTQRPESTFNLRVFRMIKRGDSLSESESEIYRELCMDPNSPRFAPTLVTQNSALVDITDVSGGPGTEAAYGYSQSGRPISAKNNDHPFFAQQISQLFGANANALGNKFRISVDGNPFVDVDLSAITFLDAAHPIYGSGGAANMQLYTNDTIWNNIGGVVEKTINDSLAFGAKVYVCINSSYTPAGLTALPFYTGPNSYPGQDNQITYYIIIASAKGDVLIEPAADKDLAAPLMLGPALGGLEISKYAKKRPAPNGIVFRPTDPSGGTFNIDDLDEFSQSDQTAFDRITIAGTDIDLTGPYKLTTTPPLPSGNVASMYHDSSATNVNNGARGVREKLNIIAEAINSVRVKKRDFVWSAEVWGARLVIKSTEKTENISTNISTSSIAGGGKDVGPSFIKNTRCYCLGTSGSSACQVVPGIAGNDGGTPQLPDYEKAFKIIDSEVDLFNIMVLPKDRDHDDKTSASLWPPASVFCEKRRAFLLIDPPEKWKDSNIAVSPTDGVNSLRIGLVKNSSAVFFPRIKVRENGGTVTIGPSGAIAGLMARIDSARGVWKAPAGTEADLRGVQGLEYNFSDTENGYMNPKAVNTLRLFPNGIVNWGARTMDGDDSFASEYKYIPVKRLALFIEETLYRNLKWVVFEPNDEPLWSQIRLNVGAFMHDLFRQGAFQGQVPRDAYFVKCDKETTTQNDINLGIVNIHVGFAPLKPAEFVIIKLQQMAGQVQV